MHATFTRHPQFDFIHFISLTQLILEAATSTIPAMVNEQEHA
ncbi:hypothetical protein SPONN_2174 [uncultured Candidatus Thioglobus sp.]|nr:hypothetical protein SPONN_2174 [uncultured Candidatus Thioglobus sp.]